MLSSNFNGVDKTDSSPPYTATSITWDIVHDIVTPAGNLTFADPTASDVDGFFNVTANEIDVDYNLITEGPWETSFILDLNTGVTIDLDFITITAKIINNSGADGNFSSKQGKLTVEIIGSVSGSLGTADTGFGAYVGVAPVYSSTLDLTSFATLNTSETYTLKLRLDGSGFGHNISLRSVTLNQALS